LVDRIYGESIKSGNDTFNGNSFFRTYVLALATAETSLFIDDFEPTISVQLQAEDRTYLDTGPTGVAMVKNFNGGFHHLFR
jgi:hypothetical protein